MKGVKVIKTIGILGGMGPLATVDLFKKIVLLTKASCDNDHIHVIIDSNTEIPDRTEYIINNGKDPAEYLVRSAIKLESMGVDAIIMPCNTAHYFYDLIIKHISIPFINMIEETAQEVQLQHPDCKRIGLLATEGTYKAGVYDGIFNRHGIEVIKPDNHNQHHIMEVIYGIKSGRDNLDLNGLYETIKELKEKDVKTFILGCTELPVAFEMFDIKEGYIDPTRVLACSAIRFAGKKVIGE